MTREELRKMALEYHAATPNGKITVRPSKPCNTSEELSLAYTPGVAQPCLEIKADKNNVWKYTSRSNMVAVVSDGTAVLGLGNIGPEAGLPVMEGKSVLFKHFADIDSVPICLGEVFNEEGRTDAKKLITAVKTLGPSFGGINLEDIASPACFEVEQTLKKEMSIPVFHDDQHGTAIISLAAILNALKLVGKSIETARFVVNGAGAAGASCSRYYLAHGAKKENFIVCDIDGVIYKGRPNLTKVQEEFATDSPCRTLKEAIVGADIFLGFSVANCLTGEMVKTMAKDPIIFAMANPEPEIYPNVAMEAGAYIVGTGRSDFPNQINNVLGFPGIFRGALDTRASDINEEMKFAATMALAELASEPISAEIRAQLEAAYPEAVGTDLFEGGTLRKDLVIPKPFDPRVVPYIARKVAQAAMETGVAQIKIDDLDAYQQEVADRIQKNR